MKPKILSPVGSFDMLHSAIDAGCDAVYLGIKGINMRERANNFDINQLKNVVEIAHKNNLKVYLTVNIIVYDNELEKIQKILKKAKEYKVDGIIAWDLSVLKMCKDLNIKIHISTQASISNFNSLKEYYNLGARTFVLARELDLYQIKNIVDKAKKLDPKIQIEIFIHGAMCVALSGRCFLSQFLYGNQTSANRGKCIQPCRRKYTIKDIETNKELELRDDYVLSPKDLSTIKFIDKIIKTGAGIFKIEGRARSPEYVKIVTQTYKKAIDLYFEDKLDEDTKNKLEKELKKVYNRDFSDGFYHGKPINQWTNKYGSKATKQKLYVGEIKKIFKKINVIEIKIDDNQIKLNDEILIIGNKTGTISQKIKSMQENIGINREYAKKGDVIAIKLDSIKLPKVKDKVFLFKDIKDPLN